MLFIDANIFLEVQLKQTRTEECEKLLEFLETSPLCAWTNSFLVYSMILTIQNKTKDNDKVRKFIKILNSYTGLGIFNPNLSTIHGATLLQEKYQLDFDDALVIASLNKLKLHKIVTFDSHFENIPSIRKITPSKALVEIRGNQN